MNKSRQLIIEKTVEDVRDKCNIRDYGFQNIFEAAEKMEYRVIRYPIGRDCFSGFSLIKDDERIIFSNSSLILSREIFTVAHEIGHQKLHLSEQGETMIRDDTFNDSNENEIEANYFAACLLMPIEKIEKFIRLELKDKKSDRWNGLDIARIQTTFNVSYDMVLIRFKTLGIIDDILVNKLKVAKMEQTTNHLLKTINGNVDLCKPTEVKKVPADYLEWVLSNYNEKLIPMKSLEVALNFLDLKTEDFENSTEEIEEDESFDDLLKGMD